MNIIPKIFKQNLTAYVRSRLLSHNTGHHTTRTFLANTVRKRQLGWLGHVLRRNDDETAKIFALYQPKERHGKHKVGRPQASYYQHAWSTNRTRNNRLHRQYS